MSCYNGFWLITLHIYTKYSMPIMICTGDFSKRTRKQKNTMFIQLTTLVTSGGSYFIVRYDYGT